MISLLLQKKNIPFSTITPITESNHNQVFSIDDVYILKWKQTDSLLAREFAILQDVQNRGLKVPKVIFHEKNEDGEFLLMEKLQGKPLDYEWKNYSEAQRISVVQEIVAELQKIHAIPVSKSEYIEIWNSKEYQNTSYSALLSEVFSQATERARGNPNILSQDLEKITKLFNENVHAFDVSIPSFVHRDFWYKNILVDANGLVGIIDFELSGYIPKEIEYFSFLFSRETAKNYIEDGAEDYTELEFLELLVKTIWNAYPDLAEGYDSRKFLVYGLVKYMILLGRYKESWYSHNDAEKFLKFIKQKSKDF